MKFNKWTLGLAAIGAVSLTSVAQAEEKLNPIQAALNATTIEGYIDVSIEQTLCPDSTAFAPGFFGGAAGIPFRAGLGSTKRNGFNLNAVELTIQKALDEAEWASGYRLDMIMGPDAVGFNSAGGGGDLGIKQAYVALRTPAGNGIDWKLGVFDTIIGYEVFEAGKNPNFTRSWGYAVEPTQHTGLLGTYRVNDSFSFSFGFANTLIAGINARNAENGPDSFGRKTVMGSAAYTAPDTGGFLSGSTFYGGVVAGYGGGVEDQVNYYFGATLNTPVTGLKTGVAVDIVNNVGGIDGNDAFVLGFYVSHQTTEKLSLHGRAEYAGGESAGGDDNIIGLTATAQYDLWKNVISRLEVRWDQGNSETVAVPTSEESHFSIYLNTIYNF